MDDLLPNFFIVGAPKCGTTTLAQSLREHPNVFMSRPKEPHHFNADLKNQIYPNKERYLGLFRDAQSHHVAIGEASTWYLYSREAVPRIERFLPNVRYIVMSRDPVEMVESLYLHNIRHLHEDAKSLETAWRMEEVRRYIDLIPRNCPEPAFLYYRSACAVGHQLTRMLQYVDASRVLHIYLDEMRHNPKATYQRVLTFLGLPILERDHFGTENCAAVPRSRILQRSLLQAARLRRSLGFKEGFGLVRLNERRIDKEGVPTHLATEIRRVFEEDQRRLADAAERISSAR